MKNALLALLQFVLFLLAFAVGSFLAPFHIEHVLSVTEDGTRLFIWDGVVLMIAIYLVVLLVESVRKRIRFAGPWSTAAFLLAGLAGYAARFGFLTRAQ